MNARLGWTAFVVWFGVLWWLSSGPVQVPMGDTFALSDKVCHFGYYAIGGLLLGTALSPLPRKTSTLILLGTVILALVGASDEFHQTFVPGRSGNDLDDWIADVLGGACGALIAIRWWHRTRRKA